MKKVLLCVALCVALCVGCSTHWATPDKEYSQEILRIKTVEDHLSIERMDTGGLVVDAVGSNAAPKIVLGKVNHSQLVIPKLTCTRKYREDETLETETCTEIPQVSIEAKVDAKGAYAGDMINTGEAAVLGSGYAETEGDMTQVWIEQMKTKIQGMDITETEKTSRIKALEAFIPFLSTIFPKTPSE